MNALPPADRPVRVALVGYGRMGRAIEALAAERGCEIVARLDVTDTSGGVTAASLGHADVAIEFTVPTAVLGNVRGCLAAGIPVVIGTTGWQGQRAEVEAAVAASGGRAVWSPNFSLGVQLFLAVAEELARRVGSLRGFDTHVIETHHAAKLDAPSGTALALTERLTAGGLPGVPVTSVRVGAVPGTHEVVIDGPFEQLRLVHEARDRRVFADGALAAARWLASTTKPGLHTMQDMLAPPARASADVP